MVAALMVFTAGPSSALVGSPDDVPGTHVILPFFFVSIDGAPGAKGDNTLVAITEVSGEAGTLHWTLWDKRSRHIANGAIPYTKYDVVSVSVQNVIVNDVGGGSLNDLAVDADGDGIMDHYMGYMTFDNSCDACDNLIAHAYQVDLMAGQAAGTTIPAREYAERGRRDPWNCRGYKSSQNSYVYLEWQSAIAQQFPWVDWTDYEVFTAYALRESKDRESGRCREWNLDEPWNWQVPSYFRLLPRYFLWDQNAFNYLFIWTSGNWGTWDQGGEFRPDEYRVVIDVFDEDEVWRSGQINIPYELNLVDVADIIPTSWLPGDPIGGWFDIRWDYVCRDGMIQRLAYPWLYDAIPMAAEWLAYSWQVANGPLPGLNWAALFNVHRDVGRYMNPLCDLRNLDDLFYELLD